MGKTFDIPTYYRSHLIGSVKTARKEQDHYKRDLAPSLIDVGPLRFKIARHFGFCYGVENAIEITYRAVRDNPGKRIFLLSEMIHNPHVNADLRSRGVRFVMKTDGEYLMPFEELRPDDIVIIPAFGTTRDMFERLDQMGIDAQTYNATCPFVEKVWRRSEDLGERGFSVIIHGKQRHEETRATFSHAERAAPSLIVRDVEEAELLARYIRRELPFEQFSQDFPGRSSASFVPTEHLLRFGVVNQTTMLATETARISDLLRQAMEDYHGREYAKENFANTRDTLCYATSENQRAMESLIGSGGDLALVVGGYNSSNTSHLVELCEGRLPAYYIKDAGEIVSERSIRHLELRDHKVHVTEDWLSPRRAAEQEGRPTDILITAGASCPDALVDEVMIRACELFGIEREALEEAVRVYSEPKSD